MGRIALDLMISTRTSLGTAVARRENARSTACAGPALRGVDGEELDEFEDGHHLSIFFYILFAEFGCFFWPNRSML